MTVKERRGTVTKRLVTVPQRSLTVIQCAYIKKCLQKTNFPQAYKYSKLIQLIKLLFLLGVQGTCSNKEIQRTMPKLRKVRSGIQQDLLLHRVLP